MVGFRDFDGVGIAPVSNKMAVKTKTNVMTSRASSQSKKSPHHDFIIRIFILPF